MCPVPEGMSWLHPGQRYVLVASYGCTRRTSTSSPIGSRSGSLAMSTEERPDDQADTNSHGSADHEVVER